MFIWVFETTFYRCHGKWAMVFNDAAEVWGGLRTPYLCNMVLNMSLCMWFGWAPALPMDASLL